MSSQNLERVVLGSLVMCPHYLEIEDINSADFSSLRFRKVFEIISEIWETERPEEISFSVLAGRFNEDHSELFVLKLLDGLQRLSPEQFSQNAAELRWLRISEAAAYLSIHPKTAYDWAARGLLPTARIGGTRRVDRIALDAGLERQVQAGQGRGKRP